HGRRWRFPAMAPGDRYATLLHALVREEPLLSVQREFSELELQANRIAGDVGREFQTVAGEEVRIVQFGVWNREAGPDFADAAIGLGGSVAVRGCIVFYAVALDWERHGSATNPDYVYLVPYVMSQPSSGGAYIR